MLANAFREFLWDIGVPKPGSSKSLQIRPIVFGSGLVPIDFCYFYVYDDFVCLSRKDAKRLPKYHLLVL